MQIKSIKASRSPQVVRVFFTDGSFLPLSVDSIIKHRLVRSQELSALQYRQIVRRSLSFQLYNYALRRVAACPQTEKVLRPRLKLYLVRAMTRFHLALSPVGKIRLVNHSILRLQRHHLLNDADFIRSYITKNKTKSIRFLEYQLSRLGFSPPQYCQLLPQDTAKIHHLIKIKVSHGLDLTNNLAKNKLIASLARRGFSYGLVKTAIDEIDKNR